MTVARRVVADRRPPGPADRHDPLLDLIALVDLRKGWEFVILSCATALDSAELEEAKIARIDALGLHSRACNEVSDAVERWTFFHLGIVISSDRHRSHLGNERPLLLLIVAISNGKNFKMS